MAKASDVFPVKPRLPVGSVGLHASGVWGAAFFVMSESTLFLYLLFAYYYFAVQPHGGGPWPPGGPPGFLYSGPQTAVLLFSSVCAWWAYRAVRRGLRGQVLAALGLMTILGLAFVALQALDWVNEPFSISTDAYSSLYLVITGAHLAHVVVGVVMLLVVFLWTSLGYFGPYRHAPVLVVSIYWIFVTIIWLALFFTLDITPYLS